MISAALEARMTEAAMRATVTGRQYAAWRAERLMVLEAAVKLGMKVRVRVDKREKKT